MWCREVGERKCQHVAAPRNTYFLAKDIIYIYCTRDFSFAGVKFASELKIRTTTVIKKNRNPYKFI